MVNRNNRVDPVVAQALQKIGGVPVSFSLDLHNVKIVENKFNCDANTLPSNLNATTMMDGYLFF